jgi:hypothetical protein
MKVLFWMKLMAGAAIGGAANAILLVTIVPEKFQFSDLSTIARVAAAGALIGLVAYLKQRPIWNGEANGKK